MKMYDMGNSDFTYQELDKALLPQNTASKTTIKVTT